METKKLGHQRIIIGSHMVVIGWKHPQKHLYEIKQKASIRNIVHVNLGLFIYWKR